MADQEFTPAVAAGEQHHQQEQQQYQYQHQEPPVSTTLTTSSATLSLDGKPPFVTTTEYECTTSKPIWALVSLFICLCDGILIIEPHRLRRDGTRHPRRVGPRPTVSCEDFDWDAADLEESELVRLEPGSKFSTSYTICVVPKLGGIIGSDTHSLVKGTAYWIKLLPRKWRWMFESEMEEGLSEEVRRDILAKMEPMEWEVDCKVDVTAV